MSLRQRTNIDHDSYRKFAGERVVGARSLRGHERVWRHVCARHHARQAGRSVDRRRLEHQVHRSDRRSNHAQAALAQRVLGLPRHVVERAEACRSARLAARARRDAGDDSARIAQRRRRTTSSSVNVGDGVVVASDDKLESQTDCDYININSNNSNNHDYVVEANSADADEIGLVACRCCITDTAATTATTA